jgi:hypothetical protein
VRKDVSPEGKAAETIAGLMKDVATWTPDWAAVLKDLQDDAARWRESTGT